MAEFSLNIKTESTQELLDIVSRINGAQTKPYNPAVTAELLETAQAAGKAVIDEVAPAAIPEHHNVGSKVPTELPDVTPDRDAHGIKRDDRIHANAADPFKADGTWKRRKNVPDEQYEEIYLELAREARAAGLYTGPAIPELELEDKVVDTEAPAPAAPAQIAPEPTAAPVAPAPGPAPAAPAPTPAPAPGMSAEDAPTPVKAVQALVAAAGPMAAHSLFKAFGVTAAPDCTPQQLRDMVAIAEKLAATLPPAEKMTRGQEALANVALEFGYIVA